MDGSEPIIDKTPMTQNIITPISNMNSMAVSMIVPEPEMPSTELAEKRKAKEEKHKHRKHKKDKNSD